MQYQKGTVMVTRGSITVTAVDPAPSDPNINPETKWLTEVGPGDLFILLGDGICYQVKHVVSDTVLSLSSAYRGNTRVASGSPLTGAAYTIHRDFTTNYLLPVFSPDDKEIATLLRVSSDIIDLTMKSLLDRIEALE